VIVIVFVFVISSTTASAFFVAVFVNLLQKSEDALLEDRGEA
jgi:uncharacterized membrane protein YpjA